MIEIRDAVAADITAITELTQQVQLLHSDAHGDWFKAVESGAFAVDETTKAVENDACHFLVAVNASNKVIGYLSAEIYLRAESPFTFAARIMHINHICVDENAKGSGIGRKLMSTARQIAVENDVDRVTLNTWSFNTAAQAFFSECGFQPYNIRYWMSPKEGNEQEGS